MLRYLYLLICIDVCFSYNFVDSYGKYIKKHVGRKGHREKYREHVQVDLAEFMRTEKSELDVETGHGQSNYNYMTVNNDNIKDENEYLNIKDKDNELNKNLKDLLSMEEKNGYDVTQNFVDDQNVMLVDSNDAAHSPEKKCIFKHMKIPFFSHSGSTTKSRKPNKKKNTKNEHPNKDYKKNIADSELTKKSPKNIENKLDKRFSNKFLQFGNKMPKMIHNSRQYFERQFDFDNTETSSELQFKSTLSSITKKDISHVDYDSRVREDMSHYRAEAKNEDDRKKRDDREEKDKRLQEIHELERKVENVEIDSLSNNLAKSTGPSI